MINEERRYHIAVWIIIASEALLFAGLFAMYAAYRNEYPAAFSAGVRDDLQVIGGINTLVLLTSSFFVAWAIHVLRNAREGRSRGAVWALVVVLLLGMTFLVLKGIEWTIHVREGVVPGPAYAGPDNGPGTHLFFTLYYGMTGLHALHVIAGLGLITWVTWWAHRAKIHRERRLPLELVALYWHFVDVVWVFLWPMFYLMRG